LVDTLASGASDRKVVEVQVLSWAPSQKTSKDHERPFKMLILKWFFCLWLLDQLSFIVSNCHFCGTPVEREWNAEF